MNNEQQKMIEQDLLFNTAGGPNSTRDALRAALVQNQLDNNNKDKDLTRTKDASVFKKLLDSGGTEGLRSSQELDVQSNNTKGALLKLGLAKLLADHATKELLGTQNIGNQLGLDRSLYSNPSYVDQRSQSNMMANNNMMPSNLYSPQETMNIQQKNEMIRQRQAAVDRSYQYRPDLIPRGPPVTVNSNANGITMNGNSMNSYQAPDLHLLNSLSQLLNGTFTRGIGQ